VNRRELNRIFLFKIILNKNVETNNHW